MTRICVYIDGYNMYHALDNFSNAKRQKYEHYKWLNLRALIQNFLGENDKLVSVSYFSAYAYWKLEAMNRHKLYVQALESEDVHFIEGRFKRKEKRCQASCKENFTTHEEKETDVNIGLYLLRDAYDNIFDKAILISQDSDLCPVVKMVKDKFPDKKLKIITPLNAQHSGSMTRLVSKKEQGMIKEVHVQQSLFGDKITLKNGKIIMRPPKYNPPNPPAST